jgi:hypothetical protein
MLTAEHRTRGRLGPDGEEVAKARSVTAMYFRKVTVPISALPAVQEELELVDAEVHRLALGSSELGMDTAVAQLLATGGKRMRSVLLLLTHRAFGGVPDGTEITAAARSRWCTPARSRTTT